MNADLVCFAFVVDVPYHHHLFAWYVTVPTPRPVYPRP